MGRVGVLDCEQFWRTSLYRALIANSLASHVTDCYPEEAFVACLIMEIGLPLLFELRIKGDTQAPLIELEPLEDLIAWEKLLRHRSPSGRPGSLEIPTVSRYDCKVSNTVWESCPISALACAREDMRAFKRILVFAVPGECRFPLPPWRC